MRQRRSSVSFDRPIFKRFSPFAAVWTARAAPIFIVLFASVLLAGCAGMRIVDSQVAAFSKLEALPAGTIWRFERLPSQQKLSDAAAIRQTKIEGMAAQELSKFGFKPQAEKSEAAATFSVQLSARIQRLERGPFDAGYEPWGGYGYGYAHRPLGRLPGRDYIVTGQGRVIYLPLFPHLPPPWYVREITLVIRDTKTSSVVYETKAQHEGRWADDAAVLPAMFVAALQGFPKPPEGKRVVNIEIPR